MAVGYDGSIRIQTKIDQSGFNTGRRQIESGLLGITKSLKGMAAAAGIAFGISAIINFSKASVKAASDLSNAMMGLQSIMDGQGRSFSDAQKFINEYISDGLVPATQAITAYKNLASRGYDDTQIRQVLVALKDSASYGRQASLTMGEAIQGATEGLKNENSILVDNAGVTKNVAKMWDDYATSIGTTAANLTKEQKIQAEVLGILEETRFQTGDAAKVASSYSGQVMQLTYNFNNLKVAVGNALIPLARAVLPSINAMIIGFTRLANVFAQVSAAIFGKQGQIASSGTAASKAENGLAKATDKVGTASKKANKELNNTLANFDEINVLASNAADSAEGVATALADTSTGAVGSGGDAFGSVEIPPKIQEFVDGLRERFAVLIPYVERVKEAWGRFKQTMEDFIASPGVQAVTQFIKELLLSIADRMMTSQLLGWAAGLDIVSGALHMLSGFLTMVTGLLSGNWAMAFEGAKQIVDGFMLALQGLGSLIEAVLVVFLGREAVEAIKAFISEWAARISKWWTEGVKPWFTKEKWSQLWADVKQWWADGWIDIGAWWDETISAWWTDGVTPWFTKEKWLGLLTSMKDSFIEKWGEVSSWWPSALSDWWENHVTPWFTKAKWVSIMQGVKEGFAETFRNAVNAAIELFNNFIGWVNSKMRFSWDAIKIAGKQIVPSGSVQLFTIPSIPRLATGAVIPPNAERLAIVGDNKRENELIAPESTFRGIVQEELSKLDLSPQINITASGSMGQMIRLMKFELDKEGLRRGHSLIKGAPI